jgi:hypothetical protein
LKKQVYIVIKVLTFSIFLQTGTIRNKGRSFIKFESEIAENEKRHKKKYKENAELRRDWVQTLLVRGNTQWEIAESLDVSQSTIVGMSNGLGQSQKKN